jgi:hypothetical protein
MTSDNGPRRWTREEDERLRQLALAGSAPFDIALELGRSKPAVTTRAHQLGVTLAQFGKRRRPQSRWG